MSTDRVSISLAPLAPQKNADNYESTERAEDNGRIVKRIKPGFIWRGNVLRPEEVIALRCHEH